MTVRARGFGNLLPFKPAVASTVKQPKRNSRSWELLAVCHKADSALVKAAFWLIGVVLARAAGGRLAPAHLVAAATSVDTIRTAACVETVRPAIDSAFLGLGIGSDTLGILVRLLKSASLFCSEDYGVRKLCSAKLALRIASIENPGATRWTTRCFLGHAGTPCDRFRAIFLRGPDDSNWSRAFDLRSYFIAVQESFNETAKLNTGFFAA